MSNAEISARDLARHYREVRKRLRPTPVRTVAAKPVLPPVEFSASFNGGAVVCMFGAMPFAGGAVPTISLILRVVSELTGVETAEILGGRRSRNISNARWAAMLLLRDFMQLSTLRIAKALNLYDHSSVIHGCRRLESIIDSDPVWRSRIDAMRSRFVRAAQW